MCEARTAGGRREGRNGRKGKEIEESGQGGGIIDRRRRR